MDADNFSGYDFWLSPEGRLQVEEERTVIVDVQEWCQSCNRKRMVDWVPEPRKAAKPRVESDCEDMEVWLEELRMKVEGEEDSLEPKTVLSLRPLRRKVSSLRLLRS